MLRAAGPTDARSRCARPARGAGAPAKSAVTLFDARGPRISRVFTKKGSIFRISPKLSLWIYASTELSFLQLKERMQPKYRTSIERGDSMY